MSTVNILPPRTIPGLQCFPTNDDLTLSQTIYNSLPLPEEQPNIPDTNLQELGELFVRHKAHSIFGIHLLHRHFLAPPGTALLGTPVQLSETTQACWTKAIPIAELASTPLYGLVFRLQPDGSFAPYEFHVGESDFGRSMVGPAFFKELADFLRNNHLSDLLALRYLDRPASNTIIGGEVGAQGTVMICAEDSLTVGQQSKTTTGWSFKVGGSDGAISGNGGDACVPRINHTHKVFRVSESLLTLMTLKMLFRTEGIIG